MKHNTIFDLKKRKTWFYSHIMQPLLFVTPAVFDTSSFHTVWRNLVKFADFPRNTKKPLVFVYCIENHRIVHIAYAIRTNMHDRWWNKIQNSKFKFDIVDGTIPIWNMIFFYFFIEKNRAHVFLCAFWWNFDGTLNHGSGKSFLYIFILSLHQICRCMVVTSDIHSTSNIF